MKTNIVRYLRRARAWREK